jgi:YgiT-type zinc finger domain-containing protein
VEIFEKEDEMSCVICRNGTTRGGSVTVTLQRGETTVILKQAPADICDNCGEYYLSSEVTAQILERAESAVKSGAEAAPLSPAQRRERFYNGLPATTEVTQYVERIYAAANAEKLSLMHGEYTGADLPAAGLVRYKITLPLKGSYSQIRRFIAESQKTVPGLALDDVAVSRQSIGEAQVEARVQLSLFLARR